MATASAPRLRDRLIPRSVLGLSSFILALALGAAFSGAVLYAYYEYQLDQTESRVADLEGEVKERASEAVEDIERRQGEAVAAIRAELEPLQRLVASGETLEELLEKVAPSVFFVSTLDEAGQPSVGSAFVVFADADQSFLLTSYHAVRAATREPAPPIVVRKDGEEMRATMHTWQEERDLALLVIPRGGLPRLNWADGNTPTRIGERLFAVSGLGAGGGSITQGFVADVSSAGIQHDAPIGAHFQGAPLVDSDGRVLAVGSRAYAPFNFRAEGVFFGPPVRSACERVLSCPDGQAPGEG